MTTSLADQTTTEAAPATRRSPLPPKALVAVMRAATAEHFLSSTEVLRETGIACFEYTLTTEGALPALSRAREQVGDALLGVGTVRTVSDLRDAAAAGADFAVSQFFLPELVTAAAELGLSYIPGALTPTEIVSAWNTGVPAVKVSPIGPLGGTTYLRELRGPLPDVDLMPTGGITLEAAAEYLRIGAVAVGVSGALFEDALQGGDLGALRRRSEQLVATLD
jgi:2-dehydro-3-deoxyphosphogluconate aldolase / (4S)-4-hydroxy-2-oxoglutarate aldolase